MKKTSILFTIAFMLLALVGCSEEEWSNNNAEMENIYYFGFQDWGKQKNDVKYSVTQGDTIAIPVEFFSEQNKNYDVEVIWFTKSDLTLGSDYQVVDENGSTIQPQAEGGWSMTWPNAKKGVQHIRLKAIAGGKKGSVTVMTCNPANNEISTDSTTIAKTGNYEVRGFSQNHKVTVTIN